MIYTQVYSMYMVAGMESDEDVRRVPEFGLELAGPSSSERGPGSAVGPDQARVGQRRRGRSPADKEHKRLKRLCSLILEIFVMPMISCNILPRESCCVCFACRCYLMIRLIIYVRERLLRNRVSAQQARERKKAYLNDLEAKVKDLEAKNSELEERMSTLQNENTMLRQHVAYDFCPAVVPPFLILKILMEIARYPMTLCIELRTLLWRSSSVGVICMLAWSCVARLSVGPKLPWLSCNYRALSRKPSGEVESLLGEWSRLSSPRDARDESPWVRLRARLEMLGTESPWRG
ncbi:hypothetical protein GW17_00048222 [Ensete ventricosum]|nr:hypothetical protein GW17_00048222 [Ensete ventricosum]